MSLTLGEVLENAEYNLKGSIPFQVSIGEQQMINYNILKEKGYSDDDDFNEIMEDYNSVEEIPNKQ